MNCTRATRHTSASVPIVPTFNRYFSVPKVPRVPIVPIVSKLPEGSNLLLTVVMKDKGKRIKDENGKP
jgi:hypothetical protein